MTAQPGAKQPADKQRKTEPCHRRCPVAWPSRLTDARHDRTPPLFMPSPEHAACCQDDKTDDTIGSDQPAHRHATSWPCRVQTRLRPRAGRHWSIARWARRVGLWRCRGQSGTTAQPWACGKPRVPGHLRNGRENPVVSPPQRGLPNACADCRAYRRTNCGTSGQNWTYR